MKTRSPLSPLVHGFAALLFVSGVFADSPALQGSISRDSGAGKPGSGSPRRFGHIDLKPETANKLQDGSNGVRNSTVAQVQRALKQRGFYSGRVDGIVGVRTRAAASKFRRENGLPSSAQIDRPLLEALGL